MMVSKGRTCYSGRNHLVKVCLLIPDYTAAICNCFLNYTTRQARNQEVERNVRQYIQEFTTNKSDYVLSNTKPPFNLTSKLITQTSENQSLADFVIAGGLYNIFWFNLSAGYSANANIGPPSSKTLRDYLRKDYDNDITDSLRQKSRLFDYPLGAYKPPLSKRDYNYMGFDWVNNPPSLCYCSTGTGFAYRINFWVDTTLYLTRGTAQYWSVNTTLFMTDTELAVDDYASYAFGEVYLQSFFESTAIREANPFSMKLHFKGQYDNFWNSTTSEVNNKLRNMTTLQLKFLNINLTLTSPPRAIGCYSRVNYVDKECIEPTISLSTSQNSTTMTSTPTDALITTGAANAEPSVTTAMSSNPSTSNGVSNTLVNSVDSANNSSYLTTRNNNSFTGNTSITQQSNFSSTTNVPAYNNFLNSTPTYTSINYMTGLSLVPNQILVNSTETVSPATGNTNNMITTDLPFTTTSSETIPTAVSSTTTFSDLNLTSLSQTPVNASQSLLSSSIKASTTELSTGTTFDKDPLFLAQVPVISKVYNDRILLKRAGGTVEYVSDLGYFYTIAIPAALGILIIIGLCLLICQTDWIALLSPKKA